MTDIMTNQYEAQSELFKALRNNTKLTTLAVGGYHNLVADQKADIPRIVYTEVRNTDEGYADNKLNKATVNFQISIFTNKTTIAKQKEMTKEIAKTMTKLKYKKYDSIDLYEDDTKLYHRALRFTKNFYKQ